jgi:alkylation response protein AidB-like acyl-CoA dehydrogenase
LLEAIATQQRILASAFAEPGLGGAVLRSTTRATRTKGGYRATGVKSPCSLAAHCDLVCLQMQVEPPAPGGLLLAVIPSTAEGVRVEQSWDSLGMRASGSETLVLDDCFVPDELVFHRCHPGFDGDEILAAGLVWFCITTTATYLGVVKAALDTAGHELAASHLPYLGSTRADLATVQGQLGEAVASILTVEAACVSVAARLDSREHDPRALAPVAIAVKHAAVRTVTRAVEDVAELLGGRAYRRQSSVARLWRDVQGAHFHPPTRLASRVLLGKWALGLPFAFEIDELGCGGPNG